MITLNIVALITIISLFIFGYYKLNKIDENRETVEDNENNLFISTLCFISAGLLISFYIFIGLTLTILKIIGVY